MKALAEGYADYLMAKVDTTTHNPARILKLYGTIAAKGDSTPDRPHRLAKLLSVPETAEVVPRDKLEALAALAPAVKPAAQPNTPVRAPEGQFDLDRWIAEHKLDVTGPEPWQGGRRWVFRVCPWDAAHTNRSAYIVQHASGAISAGCHHNGCADRDWHALRDVVEPGWRDRRSTRRTSGAGKGSASTPASRRRSILPWRPFPVDVLPEPVRSYVACGAKAMGCEPAFVALPLLAMLASAIGATRRVRLKQGWCEPSVLWTAIVADSGTLKSPAAGCALDALNRLQAWKLEEYPQLREQYERDKLLYEADLGNWKRKGRQHGAPPPEKPVEPVVQRYIVHDITIEALAERLSNAPRGLLSANDELGAWLGSFDQYRPSGGADVPRWLSIYRAEALIIDRKTGPVKTIFIKRAAVSVTGSITPRALARALGEEHLENGLAARIGLAMPPRIRKRWTEAVVEGSVMRSMERVVGRLLALDFGADANGSPAPIDLDLTPEGKREWVRFYNEHNAEQESLMGPLASAYSKLEGGAARLGLVVQLVRWAADTASGDAIDGESVSAGVALARWFCYEAERVYTALVETDKEREQRSLLDLVLRLGGKVSVRALMRASRRYRDSAEAAEEALGELVGLEWGEWVEAGPGPQGGHPTSAFQAYRPGDGDRTPQNTGENGVVSPSPPGDAPPNTPPNDGDDEETEWTG